MIKDGNRHILSISGGKDSAALAVYMRDRVPQMEYVFCDTHEELPETYDYIGKLEAFLGKPINRLNPDRPFEHYLRIKGFYLPSPRVRWCTESMKLKPFETFVGNDNVLSYIGIRSDEDREAYISTKPNIKPIYPFREDGLGIRDIYRILEETGIGLPKYYSWRSRSGCYFCFFQRKIEWVGLLENHPDLFKKAQRLENLKCVDDRRYTWSERESLEELMKPERVQVIKEMHEKDMERQRHYMEPNARLIDVFASVTETYPAPCAICTL
jgi:3'-phosphoadenosine 5'-phosphosulfate sulfotransferase (PAPS reductase)/FAD synthetase